MSTTNPVYVSSHVLIDLIREVVPTLTMNSKARDLFMLCEARMREDEKTIVRLEDRLEAVRIALEDTSEEDEA